MTADSPRRASTRLELLAEALEDEALDGASNENREAVSVRVVGGCMAPLVVDGDRVEVVPGRPRRGAVVLARLDGALVCHRVLDAPEDPSAPLVLAGDRTWCLDEHPPETVLGLVRTVRRDLPGQSRHGVLHLDRGFWKALAPFQARLHLVAFGHRGRAWARLVEWARLVLLEVRALAWGRARFRVRASRFRTTREATPGARRAGARRSPRPACDDAAPAATPPPPGRGAPPAG